jgi:hypothetical protein
MGEDMPDLIESSDVSSIYSFSIHYPHKFDRTKWIDLSGELKERIQKFHFWVWPFCKGWYDLLPDLKDHISPWHIVMGDVYILQNNCTKYEELIHDFAPYLGKHLKGMLIFQDTSFLVILK